MTPQTIFSFFSNNDSLFGPSNVFSDLLKLIAILERCFLVMCPFNKMLDGPWQIAAAMLAPNHLQGEKMCVCFKKYFNQSLVCKKFLPKHYKFTISCYLSTIWKPAMTAWCLRKQKSDKIYEKTQFSQRNFLETPGTFLSLRHVRKKKICKKENISAPRV